MRKSFLFRRGMVYGGLAFFFLLSLGLDSEAFARAGSGEPFKRRGPNSSNSYRQNSGSPPSSPQKNYQQQSQQPQPQPATIPPDSTPPPVTQTGFLYRLAGGLTGEVLGGMLFRRLGIHVSGWGEGFGLVDIFLILFILGIIFYEVNRLRSWRAVKSATARAGRPPHSYTHPIRTPGRTRQFPPPGPGRPTRPPGIR
jgi:hypothetical protein